MNDEEKERSLSSLPDYELAALTRKDGWAILPTEIFGTQPERIPDLWRKGLVEVYWSPRAIELRAHLIKQRRNERD